MGTFDRPEFTIEKGIEVQDEQLSEWKQVLKPRMWKRLETHVKSTNHLAKTGYDIVRGTSMYEYIVNNLIVTQPFNLKI